MVIRKRLEATVGWASTSITAFSRGTPVRSMGGSSRCTVATSRCILGGLPSSTFMGMSTGNFWSPEATAVSSSTSWRSSVAVPITANGQRSRSQKAVNSASDSGAMAST